MSKIEIVRSFRAMNTDVEVIVCVQDDNPQAGERALDRIEDIFAKVENTLSRFSPDSELSRLNASAGHPFAASPVLLEVVETALKMARMTGGVFDPTIIYDLRAAGYDRSFEYIGLDSEIPLETHARSALSWRNVCVDRGNATIFLPAGCGIDLGGIGKGWTVDRASLALQKFSSYAIDAGGDIRVSGTQANGSPWSIGVADPFREGVDVAETELTHGAICTSTTARRRWQMAGSWSHHLIDPRTGKPAQSGVVSATVTAQLAARAEIIAKTALILGPKDGLEFIENQAGAQGLMVLEDGSLLRTAAFPEVERVA